MDPRTRYCSCSTLGLLLFLLYINDIGQSINNSNYLLYADDKVIDTADKNIRQAMHYMNDDL